MKPIDESIANLKKMRGRPWKEVAAYIFTYFKYPILAFLLVIVLLVSWIVSIRNEKDTVLSGVLVNSYVYNALMSEEEQDAFSRDFLEDVLQLNPAKYCLNFRTNLSLLQSGDSADSSYSDYQTMMMITTFASAQELDFIAGDMDAMLSLAYQGFFDDLSQALTEEQLARYSPYFLYIDTAVMERLRDLQSVYEDTPELPDCTRPEDMESPVPVLIDMSGSQTLRSAYPAYDGTLAFGIVANTPNRENTLQYIDYLME